MGGGFVVVVEIQHLCVSVVVLWERRVGASCPLRQGLLYLSDFVVCVHD